MPERSEIENQRTKKGKRKYSGNTLEKKTVRKRFITVNSFKVEPKEIPYAELSRSGKETANIAEENFTVGDLAKGNFILVKLAGERSISHYIAKVKDDIYGREYNTI